jgi:hypothetical protein
MTAANNSSGLSKRCVITFGIADQLPSDHPQVVRDFRDVLANLRLDLTRLRFRGDLLIWDREYPPGSPRHADAPMAFKPFCFEEAKRQGYTSILWVDASVIVKAPLEPLFDVIEREGYLFFQEDHSVGAFCKDAALAPLGITREQSFKMRSCWSCVVGLDFRHVAAEEFLRLWRTAAADGVTFPGAKWSGIKGYPRTVSPDPRVFGHRYDQTAASVFALRLGMTKWGSKEFFGQYFENNRKATYRPLPRGPSMPIGIARAQMKYGDRDGFALDATES